MAAVADGDHEAAYGQFRQLFTADGTPWHYQASYAGLAELAAAAARTGRATEAAAEIGRASCRERV